MIKFCPNCKGKLTHDVNINGKKIAMHCQECTECKGRYFVIEIKKPKDKE